MDTPEAHTTVTVFGPTLTTFAHTICEGIAAYVAFANLTHGHYLLYTGDNASRPLSPVAWTRLVQNKFKQFSDSSTPLSPKELRVRSMRGTPSGPSHP